ncbi:helicase associated domain-containing protein [Streptomyces cyaneus]|uniref:helicase associated domain-containing protein n=1 Tax=Streptomyces cyaneus TaxID=1904 RepID=UPI001FE6D72A|nr:helicase associated domain-containing protein [Streptomyces cyaneus]
MIPTITSEDPHPFEGVRLDGDTVRIGAWLAKARTKHRSGQLPDERVRLVAALFDGDWTEETAAPAFPM